MNEKLIKLTKLQEGYRRTVYNDADGKPVRSEKGKLTVGYGLNLEDRGLTESESEMVMINILTETEDRLQVLLPFFNSLDIVRQSVLINMGYNMGVPRFMGFVKTFNLIDERKYQAAADEMLDSKWAARVGPRAKELSEMMRTGMWPRRVS